MNRSMGRELSTGGEVQQPDSSLPVWSAKKAKKSLVPVHRWGKGKEE